MNTEILMETWTMYASIGFIAKAMDEQPVIMMREKVMKNITAKGIILSADIHIEVELRQ